jgi:SAM-dependent methyltransferase
MRQQLIHAFKLAIRLSPLGPILVQILRRMRGNAALARGRRGGWDAAAKWLLSEGRGLLAEASVHDRLRGEINTDIDSELLWTAVRRELLLGGRNPWEQPELWETVISLVHQCINNEYVWYVSDEEQAALSRRVGPPGSAALPASWGELAILAMYMRLEKLLPAAAAGAEEIQWSKNVPEAWTSIVESYLSDYREDRLHRASVPSFGAITRTSSNLIAETYEDYPYPRWLDWEMPEAGRRERWLSRFFEAGELAFMERPFHMLVAGCGTGAKAISYAIGYGPQARILAVDLSRASLAYAMRMARKYGVGNIEFLQMDLLDLPQLQRTFDMVECTGVLHHLANPEEGGKALAGILRVGGIAHISLYSELARHEIVRLRKRHEDRIGSVTDDEVRMFRWRLMQDDPASIDERLSLRWDFFDMNRCRDLLFHPRERRFTLPEVGQLLDDLGLEFRGLQRPEPARNKYWTRFPREEDRRNLARWHEFEIAHPDAFGSLYEIWALKRWEKGIPLHEGRFRCDASPDRQSLQDSFFR